MNLALCTEAAPAAALGAGRAILRRRAVLLLGRRGAGACARPAFVDRDAAGAAVMLGLWVFVRRRFAPSITRRDRCARSTTRIFRSLYHSVYDALVAIVMTALPIVGAGVSDWQLSSGMLARRI